MKTRLETAKAMRAAGHTLAQIGAALVPSVTRQRVCQMLGRQPSRQPYEHGHFDRMAPWLVQQLELARHRKYVGIHKI